jgi:hypothetical protein
VKWPTAQQWPVLWQTIIFPVVRDVSGLGMGLFILARQAVAAHPDPGLIVAGLTLVGTVAAIYGHAVLSGPSSPSGTGHGGTSSSPPPLPPSSSPSSPPAGGTREGAAGAGGG